MATQKYWIRDVATGDYAQVDGAAARDEWGARGWEAAEGEPGEHDKVWLTHAETGGQQRLDRLAADGYWAGLGWTYGAPPVPPDLTKDPALRDQPRATATKEATGKAATASEGKVTERA